MFLYIIIIVHALSLLNSILVCAYNTTYLLAVMLTNCAATLKIHVYILFANICISVEYILFYIYMILYMFQCHSPKSSHPLSLPQSPKDCSIHQCLFCCLVHRVIVTIFLNSIHMHQYSVMAPHSSTLAWKIPWMEEQAAVHGVAKSRTQLSDFTFTFHFHALEKEMATHSSILAWRIPGTGEPDGLPSTGSHRVGHD